MKKTNIYVYKTEKGGIMKTPLKIEGVEPTEEKTRLIAEHKKLLTNGEKRVRTIEVERGEEENWIEVEATIAEIKESFLLGETASYKKLLDVITGEEEEG
jgi:hypothetical protein